MEKTLLLFTALLVIFSLVSSACGGGTEAPAVEEPATEEPTAEDSDEVPVEEAPSDGSVQIGWLVGMDTGIGPAQVELERVETVQWVVDEFNASQDRISVSLEIMPSDSTSNTLSARIDAGDVPDIIGPVSIGGSSEFYGQWKDLTPLIEDSNYDTSIFNQALVEFYQTEEGQVGLPWMVSPSGLFYQPRLFDKAGLNYPPANIGAPYVWPDGKEAEWSWETLTEVARFLTFDANGLIPYEAGFDKENIVQTGYHPQWSNLWVMGTFWGPGLVYAGEEGAYTVAIPGAWKDAARWTFDGMWGDEPFIANGALAASPEFGAGNIFNTGRTAMVQTQLWSTCCLADAVAWDVASFPSYKGVYHGRMDAATVHIWKDSTHPEEAFEFMTYLIGPAGTEVLLMGRDDQAPAYDALPAISAYQDEWLGTKAEQFPFVTNWEIFIQALAYPDSPSAEAWKPNRIEANKRMDAFWKLIQNDGGIDFETEWESMESDLESIFNK